MADEDFGDGWDEELDDLIDDDDDDVQPPALAPTPAPMPAPIPAPAPVDQGIEDDFDGGWGDDDLGDLDVDVTEEDGGGDGVPNTSVATTAAEEEAVAANPDAKDDMDNIGWEEDDDIFTDANDFPEELQTPVAPPRQQQQNHRIEKVHQELIAYIESLMIMLPSINAVFESEHNHPAKAHELLHYYTERPQLRAYTIAKELPRMDYQVLLDHEGNDEPIVIDNKQEIEQMFKLQPELDMLVRCANQSLLADVLQVMTDADGLVRPQYMATCLAESCRFVLRCRPGNSGGLIDCTTHLVLSLPEPSGNRYPVANVTCHILLGIPARPEQAPMIQYKLQSMDIVLESMDTLLPTAQFLMESGLLDHPPMSPFPDTPGHADGGGSLDDTFRDMFLQQSQTVSVGLATAWKQIDAVAGLQSKINIVKNATDGSVFDAAIQEQEEYQKQLQAKAQQRRAQAQAPMPMGGIAPSGIDDHTVPVSYPSGLAPPPQTHQSAQVSTRPTSLLGNFMGKLAKSVAIPDEDPSMYDQYAGLSRSTSGEDGVNPPGAGAFPRPTGSNSFAGAFPRPSPAKNDTVGAFPRPHGITAPVQAPAPAPLMQLHNRGEDTADTAKHSAQSLSSEPKPVARAPPKEKPAASPWLSQMTHSDEASPTPASAPIPQPVLRPPTGLEGAENDVDLGDMNDGWNDDIDLALDAVSGPADQHQYGVAGKNNITIAKTAAPVAGTKSNAVEPKSKVIAPPKQYSKDDDIIETRKRWVNPRPGPRCLPAPLKAG